MSVLSCDVLDELTEREIDIPITAFVTLQTAVPFDPNPTSNEFKTREKYSLLSDPVLNNSVDNPDDIVRLRINLIRYEYRDFTGEFEVLASGDIKILNLGNVYTYATPQVQVAEADNANTRYTLSGDYANVDNFLSDDKAFEVEYAGITNANPALFDTFITIDAIVTVKVDANDL